QKQEIVERITDLVADEVVSFERSAQLHVQGRFLDYPLSAKNVLLNFPPGDAIASVATFLWAQLVQGARRILKSNAYRPDFGAWAATNFGSHLAKVFFRPYTEGFWKIPCEQLSPEILPTSTRLNFMKSLRMMVLRKVSGQARSLTERELVLPLRYPTRGYGAIADAIAERVLNMGGVLHLDSRVSEIRAVADGGYVVLANRNGQTVELQADHVVSTIPTPHLVAMMSPAAPARVQESAKQLGYLALIVLYAVTSKRNLLDTSYVYYLGRPYHRLAEMDKFCDTLSPPGENMLAVEFSCHRGDDLWKMSEQELFELSLPHLEQDGILSREHVTKLFLVRAAHAYPIRYYGFREHLDNVLEFVRAKPNLDVLGRTGEYRYIDSDQCMERALTLAEQISNTLQA
ncbi:MAG: FAD-dependent oxidoreductase, partial [Anaerolineales bacterium]|nr:FAD-dependent oxidoreductase [Anaerolineales bacterium]